MFNYRCRGQFFPNFNDLSVLKDIVDSLFIQTLQTYFWMEEKRYPDFSVVLNFI